MRPLIFRQLLEPVSNTYTYLLGCPRTRQAVLIDPVKEQLHEYAALLSVLDLELVYTLETHVHADHITAAGALRQHLGSKIALAEATCLECADLLIKGGDELILGDLLITALATPGHTAGDISYLAGDRVFTGDTLLIGGTGRTDFQQGDSENLYRSIMDQLFTLPEETLVFPGHDYSGRRVSTIGQEKAINPRVRTGTTLPEFVTIMENLHLPQPAQIERALPANMVCGMTDTF